MNSHGTAVDAHKSARSPLIGRVLLAVALILAIVAALLLTHCFVDFRPPRPDWTKYQKLMANVGTGLCALAIVAGAVGIRQTFKRGMFFCGITSFLTFLAILAAVDRFQ